MKLPHIAIILATAAAPRRARPLRGTGTREGLQPAQHPAQTWRHHLGDRRSGPEIKGKIAVARARGAHAEGGRLEDLAAGDVRLITRAPARLAGERRPHWTGGRAASGLGVACLGVRRKAPDQDWCARGRPGLRRHRRGHRRRHRRPDPRQEARGLSRARHARLLRAPLDRARRHAAREGCGRVVRVLIAARREGRLARFSSCQRRLAACCRSCNPRLRAPSDHAIPSMNPADSARPPGGCWPAFACGAPRTAPATMLQSPREGVPERAA